MPKELEDNLKKRAAELYPMPTHASRETRERIERMRDAYVYGTMQKIEGKIK